MGTIVVGVDGSDDSARALHWAAEEAEIRRAELEVLYVYEHTPSWLTYAYQEGTTPADTSRYERDLDASAEEARRHAQSVVDAMVVPIRNVDVEAVAVEGNHPARILVERSSTADLLVVGSRGRGGFASLVLGSVSQQCASHAECPVAIVPAGGEQA